MQEKKDTFLGKSPNGAAEVYPVQKGPESRQTQ